MKHVPWLVLSVLMVVSAGGCQPVVRDESSPFYTMPVGTLIVVNEDLPVPEGTARVIIQKGQLLPYAAYNRYYPHCRFELSDLAVRGQRIRAGEFRVEKAVREIDYFARLGVPRFVRVSLGAGDDGSSLIMETVKMQLHAPTQPEVRRMICGGAMDFPAYADPPSIREIRDTLGDLVSVKLP
ncbi:MAG: hypothetical protein WC383_04120 [Gammaproteobacteria bacterium]